MQRRSRLPTLEGSVEESVGPVDGLMVGGVVGMVGVVLDLAWETVAAIVEAALAKDMEVKVVGMLGGG